MHNSLCNLTLSCLSRFLANPVSVVLLEMQMPFLENLIIDCHTTYTPASFMEYHAHAVCCTLCEGLCTFPCLYSEQICLTHRH